MQTLRPSQFATRFPFYRQMVLGSCGPACVMMVLSHLKPRLHVGRWRELRSWSKVWLFPFGATDEYGLAALLAAEGLKTRIITEELGLRPAPRSQVARALITTYSPLLKAIYFKNRRWALQLGVEERLAKIDTELITQLLDEHCVLLLEVDQTGYAPDAAYPNGILHWIVVVRNETGFRAQDPDLGPILLSTEELERALDLKRNFGMGRRMVVVTGTA